jgi:hypothetical protein
VVEAVHRHFSLPLFGHGHGKCKMGWWDKQHRQAQNTTEKRGLGTLWDDCESKSGSKSVSAPANTRLRLPLPSCSCSCSCS